MKQRPMSSTGVKRRYVVTVCSRKSQAGRGRTRHSHRRGWRSLLGLVLLVPPGVTYTPGAIRHDVPDARYRELAHLPAYESAVLLLDAGKPEASGVLVSDRWILTAGHEIDALSSPESVSVRLAGRVFSVGRWVRHPEYRSRGLGHGVDLALLELRAPVNDVRPAKLYRGLAERGKVGTHVGFGVSGTASSVLTNPQPSGTKRAGTNSIDQIGGRVDGRELPQNFLIADFDAPGDPTRNRIGDGAPLDLEYLPLGGDSGGGLFIEAEGETWLAGILSAATPQIPDEVEDGLYGSLVYWVRISRYADWVEAVVGEN